jgi:hypothetical protein
LKLKYNPASESITKRSSLTTPLGFVKVYYGGEPGLANNPVKPRIKRIMPRMKAGLNFFMYNGTRTQAIIVITPKIIKAKADCNPISIAIIIDKKALPSQKEKEYHKQISWLFILISITNISWIFLWQYNLLILSLPVIVLFLLGLLLIYTRLGIGKTLVPLREKLAIHTPFSVYLGWVTIATITNVAVAAASVNWDGFGINPETWAILIIIIALLLTLIVTATRKEIAYSLVIIWALIGIISKQTNTNIITTAEASAIIILIAIIATAILTKLKK